MLQLGKLLVLLAVVIVVAAAGSRTSQTETLIRAYARAHDFHGEVMAVQHLRTVYHAAFGIADRAFSVPFKRDGAFRIASVTKLFTSVIVLQLFDEGKLDLEAPIDTYLKDYTGDAGPRVTVHHLLTHTSGILNSDQVKSYQEAARRGMPMYQLPHTPHELLLRFASGPLVRAVGKEFEYNNADYIILGAIAERVGGKSYDQLLTERILRPLGMTASGVLYQKDIVPRLAPTYMSTEPRRFINDMPVYFENWYSAGAMYSTAADLCRFAAALFNNRLLKPATLDLMLTPGLDDYGYGLWVANWKVNGKSRRVALRPGRIMGANAAFVRFLDDDLTIVILSNTDVTDLNVFAREIAKAIVR
jgi:D-alanyl-D-alanine carboxypeptidase